MKRALISLLLAAALLLGGCGAMAPSDYAKSADLAVDEANEVGDTSLSFSDGSSLEFALEKSTRGHVLTFPEKEITWIELGNLIKADDPSPFPALSQIEVYGTNVL